MTFLPRKNILVPFDFSDDSRRAIDTALEIATDDSQVYLIHVLPELHMADPGVVWETIDNSSRASHVVEEIQRQLPDPKYKRMEVAIEFGDPGHCITEFAKQKQVDLIVMPSHGRRGLKRLLIGSVAERVTRLAHCPVLILRS